MLYLAAFRFWLWCIARALSYVIFLKWKSRLRFLDECHLAFCYAFDCPLNHLAAQIGRAELHWECLEGSFAL